MYDSCYVFNNSLAMVEKNKKYGYINTKGEEIIPIQYSRFDLPDEDYIDYNEELVINNSIINEENSTMGLMYNIIEDNGKCGIVKNNGEIAIPTIYDKILPFPTDDMIVVRNDNLFGLVDVNTAEEKIECKYFNMSFYSEGLLAVSVLNWFNIIIYIYILLVLVIIEIILIVKFIKNNKKNNKELE